MTPSDLIVYICGPRTGIPDENIPAIRACAENLREQGFNVIEPVMVNQIFLGTTYSPSTGERRTYPGLRADVFALLSCCNAIALMPGWEPARGCRLEVGIGITFGYTFIDWQTGNVVPRPSSVMIDHGYGEENPRKVRDRMVGLTEEREVSRR
jgi:hypothetical protein